jgi:hypothetical protein
MPLMTFDRGPVRSHINTHMESVRTAMLTAINLRRLGDSTQGLGYVVLATYLTLQSKLQMSPLGISASSFTPRESVSDSVGSFWLLPPENTMTSQMSMAAGAILYCLPRQRRR